MKFARRICKILGIIISLITWMYFNLLTALIPLIIFGFFLIILSDKKETKYNNNKHYNGPQTHLEQKWAREESYDVDDFFDDPKDRD